MLRTLCIALLCAAACPLSRSQAAPAATGSVMGHVICTDTQQPARLAHVVLQPLVDLQSAVLPGNNAQHQPEGNFHLQTVGLDGSFAIANVPQGLYYVIAEQDGYISPLALFEREKLNKPDEATLRRISRYMTSISVTAGHTTQADVRLYRGASVNGRVSFEHGAPAVNVGVALLQKQTDGTWKSARTGQLASHSNGHTDDGGNFRFSGLPAGEYVVRASIELNNVELDHIFSSNGSTSYGDGYHLQVYPGDAFRVRDTKPVKVEEGEPVSAVDVDVPLSRLHSLSGVVLHPNGAAPANVAHVVLRFADNGDELTSAEVDTDDGAFHFDFVPEGSYTLQVTRIADAQRTQVPNCPGANRCVPAMRTEVHVSTRYGDATQPVQLTGDQSGLLVHAGAPAKP